MFVRFQFDSAVLGDGQLIAVNEPSHGVFPLRSSDGQEGVAIKDLRASPVSPLPFAVGLLLACAVLSQFSAGQIPAQCPVVLGSDGIELGKRLFQQIVTQSGLFQAVSQHRFQYQIRRIGFAGDGFVDRFERFLQLALATLR